MEPKHKCQLDDLCWLCGCRPSKQATIHKELLSIFNIDTQKDSPEQGCRKSGQGPACDLKVRPGLRPVARKVDPKDAVIKFHFKIIKYYFTIYETSNVTRVTFIHSLAPSLGLRIQLQVTVVGLVAPL